ncbi:hypothetical protein PanWU01x14_167120 [Parasponia andersonii]|uniref:Uncharacterized protein n=1 Tax=Parasponia andersonii TaxID=3476 RepID=A0A2P5CB76_PARAD|nr:hypothetical protein PanWU01x14_167120 [Parasponia andersonii]
MLIFYSLNLYQRKNSPLEHLKLWLWKTLLTYQVFKILLICFHLRIKLQVLVKIKRYGQ